MARKKGVVFLKGVDTPMRTMSHGSFISCPSMRNMPFPSSSHGDVIGSDKLRRRLINIYDELVRNIVLKDFIGNFMKKIVISLQLKETW